MLVGLVLLSMPFTASAAIQTVHGVGLYQMGESDSIQQAKEKAKRDALRNAAEQAGVYVRSHTETKNLSVTDDEVTTIASQLLKVKDFDVTQEYKDNTLVIHASIVATFDDKNLQEALTKEKEVSSLKQQLQTEQKKNAEIKAANEKYHVTDEASTMLWTAYENVTSGRSLVAIRNLTDFIDERGGVVPSRAYYLRSIAYFKAEKYNEALSDIKKAIADMPTSPLYYTTEAMIHMGVVELYQGWGQPGEARTEMYKAEVSCDNAIRQNKKYWPAYYWRAYEKFVRESPRKAHDDIETCMKYGGKNNICAINLYDQLESLRRNDHQGVSPEIVQMIPWEFDPDYKVEKK